MLIGLILQRCVITNGATHWIVTEDGRLQAQTDSVYNLRRPYDLVAFMKQEQRASMLNDLKKELLNRKDEIDRNEDRDSGLEQKFYKTNPDCIEAGKPLPEFDLYISTVLPLENKGIRPEEHIDVTSSPSSNPRQPDCTAFMDLEFSMHAFEHLEGLKARTNLTGSPELGLKNAITHRESVDDYGHMVFEAMMKNKTSWILYNMAAFYWRIKGNPYHAVECIRRALHHSPRLQKDVALISLANIMHRARFSNEAAILVHAALEVSKELNVNHFTLGNIYAVLGEYNKSIICFENTLKIQPDFEAASKRRHAVLCHSKLEMALEAQHRSLQRTLEDLKDYQRKHDLYQSQSDKLLAEQVPHEVKIAQHHAFEQQKMRERSMEMDEHCRMVDRDGRQVFLCTWTRRSPTLDFDFAYLDETSDKGKKESLMDPSKDANTDPKKPNYSKPMRPPLYDKIKKHKTSDADFYMSPIWPQKEECDTYVKKVPDARNLTTVYLSPENKGFEVKALLTEAQGLEKLGEHPLPWYPPVCVPLLTLPDGSIDLDRLKAVSYEERSRIPLKYNDPSMRPIIQSHVNDGSVTEEEVGQRILTALKKNIGPPWILYNLAGLYWRIIGNNYHGIECIRRSIYLCPPEYQDIPLVNLANILYRYGRYQDAIVVMWDAINVNDAEPSTHFLMGHLLWATHNYTGAAHHYHEALAADPDYTPALDAVRAMKCYLKFHYAAQSVAPPPLPQDGSGSGGGNCQQKQQAEKESRVICKTENNEDKCVIETRLRNRINDCNGHCTQTCTITPIKMDGCTAEASMENTLISQCGGKNGKQYSSDQDDMLFSTDFTSKLDEVSDYYERRGLCEGDECSHLRVQQGNQRPHTKLELVDGTIRPQLIFLQVSPSEMQVDPEDCIIFNDGSKSAGCSREEFRTYMGDLQENIHRFKKKLSSETGHPMQCSISFHEDESGKGVCGGSNALPMGPDGKKKARKVKKQSNTKQKEQQKREEESDANTEKKREVPPPPSLSQPIRTKTDPSLPDYEMPETDVHLLKLGVLPVSKSDCDHPEVAMFDLNTFPSSQMNPSSLGIRLSDHLDFTKSINVEDQKIPLCHTELISSLRSLEHLPGVGDDGDLESGLPRLTAHLGQLEHILQTMDVEVESVSSAGTRIAHALAKNSTSWLAHLLASYYWQIEGRRDFALGCLKVALTFVPYTYRHCPLLSLAVLLQHSNHLPEAVVATSAALDIKRDNLVVHYTLANIYCQMHSWKSAVLFYQSTLGFNPQHVDAQARLRAILCRGLAKQIS